MLTPEEIQKIKETLEKRQHLLMQYDTVNESDVTFAALEFNKSIKICSDMLQENKKDRESALKESLTDLLQFCKGIRRAFDGMNQRTFDTFIEGFSSEIDDFSYKMAGTRTYEAGDTEESLNAMLSSLWGENGITNARSLIRQANGKPVPENVSITQALKSGEPSLTVLDPLDGKPHKLTYDVEKNQYQVNWQAEERPALPQKPNGFKRFFNFLFHFRDVEEYNAAVTKQANYDSQVKTISDADKATNGERLKTAYLEEKKRLEEEKKQKAKTPKQLEEEKKAQQEREEKQKEEELREKEEMEKRASGYNDYIARVDEAVAKNPALKDLGEYAKIGAKLMCGTSADDITLNEEKYQMALARMTAFEMEQKMPGTIDKNELNKSIAKLAGTMEFIGALSYFSSTLPGEMNMEKFDDFLLGNDKGYEENFQSIADEMKGIKKKDPDEDLDEEKDLDLQEQALEDKAFFADNDLGRNALEENSIGGFHY